MSRTTVDLSSHINRTAQRGHLADFPVGLEPVFYRRDGSIEAIPNRVAVVRQDTGEALAVVSDRYTLVPHQRILDLIREAITPLDVDPVPQGIYVDRGGARMRAVLKFPALARPVIGKDQICPCLKIQNTYDGTTRISVHIGAFRFVCTNLAVGGGGVFAGGFMSVHAGEIHIEQVAGQLAAYLAGFEAIVSLYSHWAEQPLDPDATASLLESLPRRLAENIQEELARNQRPTAYAAYNAATFFATHRMRSYRAAFGLLEQINGAFQAHFPLPAV
jgi:Domain of unknown function (DUF932)